MTRRLPWWDKSVHADRRPLLIARNRIRDAVRDYFKGEGFTEVECASLQVSPGNEAHLHAFLTERIGPDGARRRFYLHTSPEFAAKKLLAAGERKIYALGPVYRKSRARRFACRGIYDVGMVPRGRTLRRGHRG